MSKQQQLKEKLADQQAQLVEYVISQLEAGVSWQKCWEANGATFGLPISKSSGKAYKGGNIFWLLFVAQMNGYPTNEWGTYNAWRKAGGQVRKGESSTSVIFYKPIFKEVTSPDGKTELECVSFLLREYRVFNRAQVKGLPADIIVEDENKPDPITCAKGALYDYIANQEIKVFNAPRAAYSPIGDTITLPKAFTDEARGWSTVAHEIIHSTGHKSRLKREGVTNFDWFGSHAYSYEELIAELGSLFLCEQMGLSTDDSKKQSAAYLANWASKLKDKPEWLWKAAGEASRAAQFVLGAMEAQKEKAA